MRGGRSGAVLLELVLAVRVSPIGRVMRGVECARGHRGDVLRRLVMHTAEEDVVAFVVGRPRAEGWGGVLGASVEGRLPAVLHWVPARSRSVLRVGAERGDARLSLVLVAVEGDVIALVV